MFQSLCNLPIDYRPILAYNIDNERNKAARREVNIMTNNELIAIATKTANEILSKRSAETGEKIEVVVTKARNNGAHIRAVTKSMNRLGIEEVSQIGYNCTVYAIAGKNKIIEKIKRWYA